MSDLHIYWYLVSIFSQNLLLTIFLNRIHLFWSNCRDRKSFHKSYGETTDRISLGITITQKLIVTEYAETDSIKLVIHVIPSRESVEED